MDSLLIISAIVVAVVLLFKTVMSPCRPHFYVRERLPDDGLLYGITNMSKSCAVTERGNGISTKSVIGLKRTIYAIEKRAYGRSLDDWEIALLSNRARITDAVRKSRRVCGSVMLGHVRGLPRAFLLCNEIVKNSQGCVTKELFIKAVEAFDACAPLGFSELKILPDMMRFCLCGLLTVIASEADRRARVYLKGVSDGKADRVDLDSLAYNDYVCGLYSAVSDESKHAFEKLIKSNGFIGADIDKRRRFSACTTACIQSIVESLDTVDSIDGKTIVEMSAVDKILSRVDSYSACDVAAKLAYLSAIEQIAKKKRSLEIGVAHAVVDAALTTGGDIDRYITDSEPSKAARVATAIITAVFIAATAILTCLFVPPRYAAIFPVAMIIFYACFRVVVPLDIYKHFSILSKLHVPRKKHKSNRGGALFVRQSDTVCFGDETDYKNHTLSGIDVSVDTDNRGMVTIRHSNCEYGVVFDAVCCNGDEIVNLAACDGVFERHRTVYRIAGVVEFCAEIIASIGFVGCCCRLTVVNRSDGLRRVKIAADCAPDMSSARELERLAVETGEIRGGVAARFASCFVGLGVCCDETLCGGKTCATGFDGSTLGRSLDPTLKAEIVLTLDGFEKRTVVFGVIFSDNIKSLERTIALIGSGGYCEHEIIAARAYGMAGEQAALVRQNAPVSVCEESFVEKRRSETTVPYNKIGMPPFDYVEKLGIGGFICDGYVVDMRESAPSRAWCNMLFDGEFGCEIAHDGGCREFLRDANGNLCEIGYKNAIGAKIPNAFVALGENGLIWSPTLKPLGKGDLATVQRLWGTEFICDYNGCLCRLKRYTARGKRVEIFDLEIKSGVSNKRKIDIMFSVAAGDGYGVKRNGNKLSATDASGANVFSVMSSEAIREYSTYREGYLARGKIDRVRGYRRGGVALAPTVSVRVELEAKGAARVAFCIASEAGGADIDDLDISVAEKLFAREKEYYERFCGVKLFSDDKLLNNMHVWALKRAYSEFLLGRATGSFDTDMFLECLAVKYVDGDAVKSFITDVCARQSKDGAIFAAAAMSSATEPCDLLFPYVVKDYVDYSCDSEILTVTAPYSDGKSDEAAPVYEHCLRAVDAGICAGIDNRGIIFSDKGIFTKKTVIDLIGYFADHSPLSERKKYSSAIYRIFSDANTERERKLRSGLGAPVQIDSVAEKTAVALNEYETGEYAKAYDILSRLMRHSDTFENVVRYGAEPYFLADGIVNAVGGIAIGSGGGSSALFFVAITERLLGIRRRGSRVKINPRVAENTPHIEFDIIGERGTAHIIVDDTERDGSWQMRVDRITYATDSLSLTESQAKIVFYRTGTR